MASIETSPWKHLEVPGETGVYFCARHKNTRTRLRCGSCEKPICPKCTQYGPTGARCADCLSLRSSHMYQVSALGALAAFGVAFGAGVVGSILLSVLGGFSFLALLYAPAIGPTLGRFIVRASGGKRGTKVAVVAAAGFLVGALVTAVVPMLTLLSGRPNHPALPLTSVLAMGILFHPFLWIMVGVALVSLWVFLK